MDFDKLSEKWEDEKTFWSAPGRPKTWDMEEPGQDYSGRTKMVEQEDLYGEWVRAEHYRRDVEALEKKVTELKSRLALGSE